MDKIRDKVMVARLSISKYEGTNSDKLVDGEIEEKHNAKKAGSFRKNSMDDESMENYFRPFREAKTIFKEMTLPFAPKEGLIMVDQYEDLLKKMLAKKDEFDQGVEEFCDIFPGLIDKQEARLGGKVEVGGLFKSSDYPKDIRSKFKFRFTVGALPDSSKVSELTNLGDEEIKRIQAEAQADLDDRIASAMKEPFRRIYKVVKHMHEKLSEDGNFKNSLVGNIEELITELPKLNITGEKSLDDMLARLNSELVTNPDKLRYDKTEKEDKIKKAEQIMKDLEGYY